MTGRVRKSTAQMTHRSIPTLVVALLISISSAGVSPAAQGVETTRRLWDTAFIVQPRKRNPTGRYVIATPKIPTAGVAQDSVIGITLWRLRPAGSRDTGERLLTHQGSELIRLKPERISPSARLNAGDMVRVSIEAARNGYLYVIDQEEYADGTSSEPVLIFPTTRTRGGQNGVAPGRVIEIPGQGDSPPYFVLTPTRPDLVAESLTVLVTPRPLQHLRIGSEPSILPRDQLAEWERSWGGQAGRLELVNGVGKAWTREEKEAGADPSRALGYLAPAPQSLYYRPGAKSSEPLLFKVKLRIRKRV